MIQDFSLPKIVVLGSLNMDLVMRVTHAPEAGETLMARSFMTNPGGKGANQAVACARQGARVSMVGCVGADAFGAELRAALVVDGIDIEKVTIAAAPVATGVAMIMVDDHAQNRIAVAAGANDLLDIRHVADAADLIAASELLLLQFEVPMPAVIAAATHARKHRRQVVLNPAPAKPVPDALWPQVTILVLNETEAADLTALVVADRDSAIRAATALQCRVPIVILTMGADGVVVCDTEGCRHFAAVKVMAVDTTAAGDTFVGALCAALLRGNSLDAGIEVGIAAAAQCVMRVGAQSAIPYLNELP